MNYTENNAKTQVFSDFLNIDACKSAVNDQNNAILLFDFAHFCAVCNPLFSEVWGVGWAHTAQMYLYGTFFSKTGDKRPFNPYTHEPKGWPCLGLTAAQMIDAVRSGENYYLSNSGQRCRAKLIAMLTADLAVIDIDHHDLSIPDQREGLLSGLQYLKIAAPCEPTTHGMHVFFKRTPGIEKKMQGTAIAQDATGQPIKLEILACNYAGGRFNSPSAVMLGCGRVNGYAQQAQQLTSRLYVPDAAHSVIPTVLIPQQDASMQQAQQLTSRLYVPDAAHAPHPQTPSVCQFPPVAIPQQPMQDAPPASQFTPALTVCVGAQAAHGTAYHVGSRNSDLFKRLMHLAKSVACGDDAPAIIHALAMAEYDRMPDKSSFSRTEVDNVVKSVLDRMHADDPAAAAKKEMRRLRTLCQIPRDAVNWAVKEIGAASMSYNKMTRQPETDRPIEYIITDIYNLLRRQLTRTEIEYELRYSAQQHSYHPVLDWLQTLPASHDDTELKKLYRLLNIQQGSLYAAYIYHWLMQAVCALYNGADGVMCYPCEYVLVLQGAQRIGKTSLLCHLAVRQDWWIAGAKISADKDTTKRILHHWIAELGEIGSTMRHDQDALKAFISQDQDSYRLPWGHDDIIAPRQTALCGTVNQDDFLVDQTGGSRFWVIPVRNYIKREEMLNINVNALWAYIYTMVTDMHTQGVPYGDIFRLSDADARAARADTDKYRRRSPAEFELEEMIEVGDDIPHQCLNWRSAKDIADDLPWPNHQQPTAQAVGRALAAMGVPSREVGGRKKLYGVAVTDALAQKIAIKTGGRAHYTALRRMGEENDG